MSPRIMQQLFMQNLSSEIFYSFIIVICSLMIYFGTKEIYEASLHKGIKFFREAFLFFSLAYFFRGFIKIILYSHIFFSFKRPLPLINNLSLFLFLYFSILAILYFTYSVIYKKLRIKESYLIPSLVFIISFLVVILKNTIVYLALNLLLLLFVSLTVYFSYKDKIKKREPYLHTIYF
ncbi:MAG: hypothetical protein QW273_02210, partial [Candidatus Pacearchaeota archaeon]